MMKVLLYIGGVFVALHGFAHMVGFVTLFQAADLPGASYSLLAGQWQLGSAGMRIMGFLWLLGMLGFIISAVGLLMKRIWWRPLMFGTILFSSALIALDWSKAFVGGYINGGLAVVLGLAYAVTGLTTRRAAA